MAAMDDVSACEDKCMPNCEETAYTFTVDTLELDAEELCKSDASREVGIIP